MCGFGNYHDYQKVIIPFAGRQKKEMFLSFLDKLCALLRCSKCSGEQAATTAKR